MRQKIETAPGRLVCLDVLRGLDMALLVTLGPVLKAFDRAYNFEWFKPVADQLRHRPWTGFTIEDIIMPLFMFCAGAAIPYSMAKYRQPGVKKGKAYWRIIRRFVVLWILGMICQGNLLDLNWESLKFFSNTLQSIAIGYVVSAILYMNVKPRTMIFTAIGLLIAYWAGMMFIKIGPWGGGNFSIYNLPEYVDRVVLGSHCDHAYTAADGSVAFRNWHCYTWVYSSLTFIVTVMCGTLCGELLKNGKQSERKKFWMLLGIGAGLAAAGWLWNLQMPVIKHIWTSSMTIVAAGYSMMLLAICFLVSDWKQKRALHWAIPIGANCMLAYLMDHFVNLKPFFKDIFYGLEKYIGSANYQFLIAVLCAAAFMLFFDLMYKHRKFFRV